MRKGFLIFLFMVFTIGVHAMNNPSIKWFLYEGKGFKVIYQESAMRTAMKIAKLLEERIYRGVMEKTGFPGEATISVIVADDSDIPNGFAVEEYDFVFIYSTNLYIPVRGRHFWEGNVTSHELAHIFARRMRSIFGKNFPLLTIGGIALVVPDGGGTGFEGLIFVPFPDKVEPSWFTEGLAQLISEKLGFDSWDTTRDMLLRVAVLEEKILTYDEMVTFEEKKGLAPEMVYNQGYSFLRFLSEKYEGFLPVLLKKRSSFIRSFERLFKEVTGEDMMSAYEMWKGSIKERYSEKMKETGDRMEGNKVKDDAFFIPFSGIHHNGLRFYVKGEESFFKNKLFLEEEGKERKIDSFISSPPSFSPDGREILYTRYKITPLDSLVSEIRVYNLDSHKKKSLGVERAFNPVYLPDGSGIAFIKNRDGTHNLYILVSGNEKRVTDFRNGEQIAGMDFLTENELVLSLYREGRQDLYLFSMKEGRFLRLTDTPEEERDVRACGEGRIVFSADYGGVFNIYLGDLKEGKYYRLTNLAGGGFYPYPSPDCTKILYTSFTKDGYNIYELVVGEKLKEAGEFLKLPVAPEEDSLENGRILEEFAGRSRKYTFISNPLHFYPGIIFYRENFGTALGFDYSDKLLRHIIGGGMVINLDGDAYFSLGYVNRTFYPTLIIRGTTGYYSTRLINFITKGKSLYTTAEFYALFPVFPFLPYLSFEYRNFRMDYLDMKMWEVREGVSFESYGFGAGLAILLENFSLRLEYLRKFTNGIDSYLFNLETRCERSFGDYWSDRIYLKTRGKVGIGEVLGIDLSLEGGAIPRDVHPYDEFTLGGLIYSPLIYEVVQNINLPGYKPWGVRGERVAVFSVDFTPPGLKIHRLFFPLYLSSVEFHLFSDLGFFMRSGEGISSRNLLPDAGGGIRINSTLFYNYPLDLSFDVAYGLKEYKTPFCNVVGEVVYEEARWLGFYLRMGITF